MTPPGCHPGPPVRYWDPPKTCQTHRTGCIGVTKLIINSTSTPPQHYHPSSPGCEAPCPVVPHADCTLCQGPFACKEWEGVWKESFGKLKQWKVGDFLRRLGPLWSFFWVIKTYLGTLWLGEKWLPFRFHLSPKHHSWKPFCFEWCLFDARRCLVFSGLISSTLPGSKGRLDFCSSPMELVLHPGKWTFGTWKSPISSKPSFTILILRGVISLLTLSENWEGLDVGGNLILWWSVPVLNGLTFRVAIFGYSELASLYIS